MLSSMINVRRLRNIFFSAAIIVIFWTYYVSDYVSETFEHILAREENIGRGSDAGANTYRKITQPFAISAYSLEPRVAEPGSRLTLKYTIITAEAKSLGLACSIQKAGANTWIGDPGNDRVINAGQGTSMHSREFALPPTLSPGKYNVGWGLWSRDFTTAYDFKASNNALTISARSGAEDQSSSSQ